MWAVVPVKGFDAPKQRLAPLLDPAERAGLTRVMLVDVLTALRAADGLAGILVISADERVLDLAREHGAAAQREALPSDYNAAVGQAAARLVADGADALMHVPGDVPLITAQEVSAVIAAHGKAPAITLVAAHDGDGTNCLVLSPPDLLAPAFGLGSFARHCALARAAGVEPAVLELPGFGLDIDTPGDLGLCCGRAGAEETQRFLRTSGIAERLPQPS